MRILLLCDEYWHPGQVPIDGVEPLKELGFQFDIITDMNDFIPEMLENYSVVMLCKSAETSPAEKESWQTYDIQQTFINYVENGGGLLAIHSGLVAGEHTEALDKLIGSKFVYHPESCHVLVQPVKPHPVTKDVNMLYEFDEHYRLEFLTDDVEILIASYSPPQGDEKKYESEPYNNTPAWICAAGYIRMQGKGRVCALTPGHYLPVWHNPQFKRILENALQWCSQEC